MSKGSNKAKISSPKSKPYVKSNFDQKVDELPIAIGLWFEKQWPDSVEKELEDNPYAFRDNIVDKAGFGMAWDVHIYAVYSLEAMVLEVVLLESYRHGYTNREIGANAKPSVVDWG